MSDEDDLVGHHTIGDFYPTVADDEHDSSISQFLHEDQLPSVGSSYNEHETKSSIGLLYLSCENDFTVLTEELRQVHTDTKLDSDSIHDQFDRLKLWAGDLGAKHTALSPISLDWRLRNALDMKTAVIKLLDELMAATKNLIAIITGARPDRVTAIQMDHNDTTIESSPTESGELFETICDSITGLFHLSLIIQRATPRDRFARAVSTMKDASSSIYDMQHVASKFPKLDGPKHERLRQKLGLANAQRRAFFRYCRDNHESKVSSVKRPFNDLDNRTATQTAASTLDPSLSDQVHKEALLIDDDHFSQTSFATSTGMANNDGTLHVPHLDTVSKAREAFQCPYCYTTINPQSHRHWKKHVFEDLRPYTCTFKNCGSKLFSSRSAWFEHEVYKHRQVHQCMFCKQPPFKSRDQLSAHLAQKHTKVCPPSMISSLIMATANMPETFSLDSCPFCDNLSEELTEVGPDLQEMQKRDISAKTFRKHVAVHMEQLALFALPKLYNDESPGYTVQVSAPIRVTERMPIRQTLHIRSHSYQQPPVMYLPTPLPPDRQVVYTLTPTIPPQHPPSSWEPPYHAPMTPPYAPQHPISRRYFSGKPISTPPLVRHPTVLHRPVSYHHGHTHPLDFHEPILAYRQELLEDNEAYYRNQEQARRTMPPPQRPSIRHATTTATGVVRSSNRNSMAMQRRSSDPGQAPNQGQMEGEDPDTSTSFKLTTSRLTRKKASDTGYSSNTPATSTPDSRKILKLVDKVTGTKKPSKKAKAPSAVGKKTVTKLESREEDERIQLLGEPIRRTVSSRSKDLDLFKSAKSTTGKQKGKNT